MKHKIALISFKYPPEYSGYGKQLKSVIEKILEKDNSFNFKLLTAYKSSIEESEENFNVIPLGSKYLKKPGVVFYFFCIRVFLWLIINRHNYEIIHCIKAGPEAVVANIASKLLNKELIVKVAQDELSDREITSVKGLKKYYRKLRHYLLKDVDNYIAISEEIENSLLQRISKESRIFRIPNGVDAYQKFMPVKAEEKIEFRKMLKIPLNKVVILFVGAVNKRKGIVDLLAAVKELQAEKESVLVICGPKLENIPIDDMIEDINNSNSKVEVIFAGKVNNVDEYMKAADIFILPSYSEGLPNVLLEAAATGLALIATDIGGSRDIVSNQENGLIVPIGDSRCIEKAIKKLVDHENYRLDFGKNARLMIEENFSLDKVSESYINLYNRKLNG